MVLEGRVKTKASLDNVALDADGHPQVDVLTMPPVTVQVAEKGFSNAADTPTRALVDADRHVQADVLNFPMDYAKEAKQILLDADKHGQVDVLTVANPPNLDVALSTRASEASLTRTDVESEAGVFSKRVDIRYDNVGLAKSADISATQPRNVAQWGGTALTGRDVSADLAKLQNLDVLLSSRASEASLTSVLTRLIKREGAVTSVNVTAAAAGATVVYTPSAGKKAKVVAWSLYCDADTVWQLRFTTSGNVICGLPFKGALAMNTVGVEAPTGGVDEKVEVYVGAAATVKGWITVVEV